jgi:hypothetical protein
MRLKAYRAAAVFVVLMMSSSTAFADAEELVIFSRIGERLLITLAGVLSLLLGYSLFKIIGTTATLATPPVAPASAGGAPAPPPAEAERFEGSIGNIVSVKMGTSGPGLMFAFFGAALLAYVMFSHIDVTASGEHIAMAVYKPPDGQNIDKVKPIVLAIRKLQNFQKSGAPGNADEERASAIQTLSGSIPNIIDFALGENSYATYTRLLNPQDLASATERDRRTYELVNSIINDGK